MWSDEREVVIAAEAVAARSVSLCSEEEGWRGTGTETEEGSRESRGTDSDELKKNSFLGARASERTLNL
jgi:hypothetical protein